MKFGFILPNYGPNSSAEEIIATALAAERLSFDSLWTTDHLLLPKRDAARFGRIFESISTLVFLAGRTSRIRLGVSCLVLPQREPISIAKQMAALDIFSGGRAMVSLCVGWSKGEFDNLGKRFELRGRKLDESILLLRKLWSADHDEEIRFDGKFFPIESGVFSPGTIQRGGPPIWIGGNSDRALRRALELGDGWHSTSLSLERFRERVQAISNQIPRPDFTLSARLRVSFDASDDRAQLRGSPEAILQELLGYQRAGLEYAVLHFRGGPGEPREQNMQRFMEEIVAKMPERS